jgi:hypothetical protein
VTSTTDTNNDTVAEVLWNYLQNPSTATVSIDTSALTTSLSDISALLSAAGLSSLSSQIEDALN